MAGVLRPSTSRSGGIQVLVEERRPGRDRRAARRVRCVGRCLRCIRGRGARRGPSLLDATILVAGSMIGSGISIASAEIAFNLLIFCPTTTFNDEKGLPLLLPERSGTLEVGAPNFLRLIVRADGAKVRELSIPSRSRAQARCPGAKWRAAARSARSGNAMVCAGTLPACLADLQVFSSADHAFPSPTKPAPCGLSASTAEISMFTSNVSTADSSLSH